MFRTNIGLIRWVFVRTIHQYHSANMTIKQFYNHHYCERSCKLLLLTPSRYYKHKISVRTFLSDKERVRDFLTLLNVDEKRILLDELKQHPELVEPFLSSDLHKTAVSETATRPPTMSELKLLALAQSLPFVGFGFLDNLLMILAGDYIDLTLGVGLGISTMAAAGLGNALSDVAGIGSAYYVERLADRVGVKAPKLSLIQLQMSRTRWATQIGRAFGVALGCIIGMFPLLFIPNRKDLNQSEQ